MARKSRRAPVSRDKRFKRPPASDMGPSERWQHSGRALEFTESAGVFAARATEEHVLDRLVLLGMVEEKAREAGLKLHQDYVLAGLGDKVIASYSPVRSMGGAPQRFERSDFEEAAYRRWRKALSHVEVRARDIAIHVCCLGHLPALRQLAWLVEGLGQLQKYYGLR